MDDDQYLGYIRWSLGEGNNKPVLLQWFIVKERQRQGIGTMFLRYWAEKVAFSICDEFIIEGANEKTGRVLIKLGYAEPDGDDIKGIRCKFLPSMCI